MTTRKGIPNKNKRFLLARLQDMYGEEFNPVLRLAEQADRLHKLSVSSNEVSDIKASIDAWEKIANFVEPKLKAVEVEFNTKNDVQAPTVIQLVAAEPKIRNDY